MINLYFGNPCDDWAKETAEEMAINHNLSMEKAVFVMINELLQSFSDRSDGHSFLDDRFSWTYGRLVYAPEIIAQQKKEDSVRYSVMSIKQDYLIHRTTADRLPITEKAITVFGEDFEDSFGIEYLGHRWGGKQKLLDMKQAALF